MAGPRPKSGPTRSLAARTSIVAGFTLASRVFGYFRDITMTSLFGASGLHDAYVAALTVPNTLRRLVAEGSLAIAFVPILKEEERAGGLDGMRRFVAAVLGVLIPGLVLLTGLGMVFSDEIMGLFAAGFDGERARAAATLFRIMMPFVFFISLVALAGGALNVVGVWGLPAAGPVLLNVCMISGAFLGHAWLRWPIAGVGYGVVAGGVLQLLVLVPVLARHGLAVWPRWSLEHAGLRTLGRRMIPAVFGVAVYQLNVQALRIIGSFLPEGALSCYWVATRLQEFALGVFAVSVSVAALPQLSGHVAAGDHLQARSTLMSALRLTNFITIPASVGLFVTADLLVAVLFEHGAFDRAATVTSAALVRWLAVSLVPIGMIRCLVPSFYAYGDTRSPVWAASASLVTTVGLGAWASHRFGVQGLAATIVVAAGVQLGSLLLQHARTVRRRANADLSGAMESWGPTARHAARCLALIVPLGGILWGGLEGARAWGADGWFFAALRLGIGVAGTVVLYFGFGRVLGIEEATALITKLRRRVGSRRSGRPGDADAP